MDTICNTTSGWEYEQKLWEPFLRAGKNRVQPCQPIFSPYYCSSVKQKGCELSLPALKMAPMTLLILLLRLYITIGVSKVTSALPSIFMLISDSLSGLSCFHKNEFQIFTIFEQINFFWRKETRITNKQSRLVRIFTYNWSKDVKIQNSFFVLWFLWKHVMNSSNY